MIQIPLDVDVICTDGVIGKSSAVIVDRETVQVTHFVVKEKKRPHTERLVPVKYVQETFQDRIQMNCAMSTVRSLDEFVVTTFRKVDVVNVPSVYMAPMTYSETMVTTGKQEFVPEGASSIRVGTPVWSQDGKKLGSVTNLLEDPDSGRISHFILREDRISGDKNIIVPLSMLRIVNDKGVQLNVDQETISSMLAIPTRDALNLNDTSLAIITFVETGQAKSFLEALQKEKSIQFSNAAVLVKESDGKASLREVRDLDNRRGAVFGAITGGLMGLLGGPVGVVVGAATGAATGGVAAGKIDMGFPDEYLKKLQAGLQPGSSALVVLLSKEQASKLAEAAAASGGEFMEQELTQEILTQLPDVNASNAT